MRKLLYFLLLATSMAIAGYAFVFFLIMNESHDIFRKFMAEPAPGYAHVLAGGVALLIGPWQFSAKLRNRFLDIHRWLGRIYLTAVAISGIAGFYLALYSEGGLTAHFGFGFLALGWLYTSTQAYRAIRKMDIDKHTRWMVRSFALTFTAVTLRIYLPVFGIFLEMPFSASYPIISWLSWVPNLMIAEIVNRKWPVAT